ncbi:MAG: hypothetical protein FWH34_07185 [Desulfovibrionaceae bacterium]|nr:hypothetical protein [Desulfovibrionaceae bacterium]
MHTETISIPFAADAIEFDKLRERYERDPVIIPLIELAVVETSIIGALRFEKMNPLVRRAGEAFKTLAVMLDCQEEILKTERNLLAELAATFAKANRGSTSEPKPACKVCPVVHDVVPCDENRCAERLADWAMHEATHHARPLPVHAHR